MPKALMLEDEQILVEDLPILLKDEGWDVRSTTCIGEALEWFAEEHFDLVLLDIMMPLAADMDAKELNHGRQTGIEVARRMKERKPEVPIVAFTVLRDPELLSKIRGVGVAEIVNKPVELDELVQVMWRVIRTRVGG